MAILTRPTKMNFNEALNQVNGFGVYQKLLIALLVVPSAILTSFLYLCQFFILLVSEEHYCNVTIPAGINISADLWKNYTVPFIDGEYDKCKVYDRDYNDSTLDFSNLTDLETMECDRNKWGWIYVNEYLYPTIASELNLVCDEKGMAALSQVIYYVGTSIGVIAFGFAADKFGRKPCILVSYLLSAAAGTGSAFANNYALFTTLRFFVGACIITMSEDPYVLSLEYISMERRTLVIVFWSLGYLASSAVCSWVSYGIHNWSTLTIVTSVPLALVCIGSRFLPESASWLTTKGRTDKAVSALRKVAKVNGTSLPDDLDIQQEHDPEFAEEINNASFLSLFKTPRLRRTTILLAITNFLSYCCYHTNTQNTSNLSKDVYLSFTYGSIVELPNLIIVLFGIQIFGRRWPRFIALLVSGVAGLIMFAIPEDKEKVILAMGLMQRLGFTINTNIVMLYSAELLPTVLRGRGLAFLRFTGTLGLYIAPYLVFLALKDHRLPLQVCGFMSFGLAAITLLMPETLNQPLPHTVEEGEKFGKGQRPWDCSYCAFNQKKAT